MNWDAGAVKMQLPYFQPHVPDPLDWLGVVMTLSLSALSWALNYVNLEQLDAIVIFLIHITQWLTTIVALIVGLLTARKFFREQNQNHH